MVQATDAATVVTEEPQASPEGQLEGDKATPEVDYKALVAERDARIAQLEQRAKSAEGQVRGGLSPEVRSQLEAIAAEQRRMSRQMRISQGEDAETVQKEATAEEQAAQFKGYTAKWSTRLAARFTKAGIGTDAKLYQDAAGESRTAFATQEAFDAWYEKYDDAIDAEVEAKSKATLAAERKKLDDERKQGNQEDGKLKVGATRGVPGGGPTVTKDNIDLLYVEWDVAHPNAANPYEEKYRTFRRTGQIA